MSMCRPKTASRRSTRLATKAPMSATAISCSCRASECTRIGQIAADDFCALSGQPARRVAIGLPGQSADVMAAGKQFLEGGAALVSGGAGDENAEFPGHGIVLRCVDADELGSPRLAQ